jgi:ferredoxin-type protein NapG
MEPNETNNDRRGFVKKAATVGVFVALGGVGAFVAPKLKASEIFLRPPGAIKEKDFMATCIKCGQCIQVCPYHTLSFLDIDKGHLVGTPFVSAKDRGCYLCDLLPCVLACPSGALDHHASAAKDVKMGVAFLKRPDTCLATRGELVRAKDLARALGHSHTNERETKVLQEYKKYENKPCTICADMCPYPQKEKAITMAQDEKGRWYPQIRNECVGCGVCEELCPATEVSLVMIPRASFDSIYKG